MTIQHKIESILILLSKAYGRPPAFRKSDPVDELVRTILSQNTTDRNSLAAFAILKKKFKTWDGLLRTDVKKIAALIRHAGLANIKAGRIRDVLAEIRGDKGKELAMGGYKEKEGKKGKISFGFLEKMSVKDSLEYLKSLKGVGPKTAACVLLFSFGRPVMPVDTHIFRVTRRLGLIDKDLNIEEAHDALSAIVPKHLIYEFHLGIIEHGRKTCKAQGPRCGSCILYGLCRFEKKAFYRKKELCR